jgi:hypothetical protein
MAGQGTQASHEPTPAVTCLRLVLVAIGPGAGPSQVDSWKLDSSGLRPAGDPALAVTETVAAHCLGTATDSEAAGAVPGDRQCYTGTSYKGR